LGKTEFPQEYLKIYDLMKKQDFIYTGLRSHKNIIYKNGVNPERLEDLVKMFSGDPLVVKIPCEFDLKEFCSHYRKYEEKDMYSDLVLKIYCVVKCKHNPNTDNFTVILYK
jgi:hypothetical protein